MGWYEGLMTIVLWLTIIGAIGFGVIGLMNYDPVNTSYWWRVIYIVIALAGILVAIDFLRSAAKSAKVIQAVPQSPTKS
jgi:uncharacterized membrane protein YuzA (DUF378 family)